MAEKIAIDSSSGIYNLVDTGGVGNSGNIIINTGSLEAINGGLVNASTFGRGNAGSVKITATGDLTFDRETSEGFVSGVFSQVTRGAVGNAGGVTISTNNLTLTNGGVVDSSTRGQGGAGTVNIIATGDIIVDGKASNGISSGVTSLVDTGAVGNAEAITISTNNLTLTNNGRVSVSTSGKGNAGNVFIKANQSVSLVDGSTIGSGVRSRGVGDSGDVEIQTKTLSLTNGSQVGAFVFRSEDDIPGGRGNGGNIKITATDSIDISGVNPERGFPSGLIALTEQGASGKAGNIQVDTGNLRVADAAAITVGTRNPSDGGNIVINANTLEATGGGQIRATTRDSGNAGNISLNIAEKITLSGSDPGFFTRREEFGVNRVSEAGSTSGIFVNASETSTGQAGFLEINTGELVVQDDAKVDVSSLGTGSAGDLNIVSESINLNNQGSILASTPSGEGGSITLNIDNTLKMRNNSLISAKAFGDADGGNLTIDTNFIVAYPNGNNDIVASAKQGQGGEINITAEALFGIKERPLNPLTNDINASSEKGAQFDGNVTINIPDVNPVSGASELPNNPVEPEQTVAEACRSDLASGQTSGLVVKGRGGMPPQPIEPFNADSILVDGSTSNPNPQSHHPEIKPIKTNIGDIYPARGIIVKENGDVILTAYPTDGIDRRTPHIQPNCS